MKRRKATVVNLGVERVMNFRRTASLFRPSLLLQSATKLVKRENLVAKRFYSKPYARSLANSFEQNNTKPVATENTITINAFDKIGRHVKLVAPIGSTLLDALKKNGLIDEISIECQGNCCCTDCHVVIPDYWMAKTRNSTIYEDEWLNDLKLIHKRSKNSRLACQIVLSSELDGLQLSVVDNNVEWKFPYSPY